MQKLIPLLTQAGERPSILKGTVLDFSEKQRGYQGPGAEWVSGSVVGAVVRGWQWARTRQILLRFGFQSELGQHCRCWAEDSLKAFVGRRTTEAAVLRMDYRETKETCELVRRLLS